MEAPIRLRPTYAQGLWATPPFNGSCGPWPGRISRLPYCLQSYATATSAASGALWMGSTRQEMWGSRYTKYPAIMAAVITTALPTVQRSNRVSEPVISARRKSFVTRSSCDTVYDSTIAFACVSLNPDIWRRTATTSHPDFGHRFISPNANRIIPPAVQPSPAHLPARSTPVVDGERRDVRPWDGNSVPGRPIGWEWCPGRTPRLGAPRRWLRWCRCLLPA